ncbi:MAG: hypothetical protein JW785_04430 [Acidimicrobiia bacterium]|nr:hypothetical protein [Acidimicrobiia bacterium]
MKRTIPLLLVLLLAPAATACGDDAEEATTTAAAGEAVLTIGGTAFTMADLEALGAETFNLEHPKNGPTDYTGVRLNAVLDAAGIDAAPATITFVASDGYSYEAPGADVRACADCLAAFNDEGGINMAMPGMESKAWVKDVVEITAG